MPTKRNPFRMLERAADIIGRVITGGVATLGFMAIGFAISDHFGWGRWGLLLIPAAPVVLALLVIIVGLLHLATDAIHDAWLIAKWRWDDRHPVTGGDDQIQTRD